jgi:copper homeostasis protein
VTEGAHLQVIVTQAADVLGALEGGADSLVALTHPDVGGLSPEPAAVSAICRASSVPVRVVLRLNDSTTTTGGELSRLVGLAEDFLAVGAEGLVFGFLDPQLEIDAEVCAYLADLLPEVPWTFSNAIDATLDHDRAWRQVIHLPGLDSVLSAGSTRGLSAGSDDLIARAERDPDAARLLVAGGGLAADHVPWLSRAGVTHFLVGSSVRPGKSWMSYVDAGHVRSWRMLLDDAYASAR